MKRVALAILLVAIALTSLPSAHGGNPSYKPKRINKMIELLEAGQPVYDVSISGAGYEEGKKLARSHIDLIQYQMEHGPFDPIRLREYARLDQVDNVLLVHHGASVELTNKGRAFTKRQMPY